jgi:CheY-like chemotaxis protein
MPRTLGDPDFERLVGDSHQLVERATEHEHQLVALVNLVESLTERGVSTPLSPQAPAQGSLAHGTAGSRSRALVDLLSTIRHLCVAARNLRAFAENILLDLRDEAVPAAAPGLPRTRVLVVDDAEDTRELLAIALETAGLETITASNGLEALLAAHSLRPTVILMDVNMPVLDGIEAARLLKAALTTRHAHVIAHTAEPDLLEGSMKALFAHVLPKPSSPADVVSSVLRVLSDASYPAKGARDLEGTSPTES